MKTITVDAVRVQCRPMTVQLAFAHDRENKQYLVRIDTRTEGVKLPGFVIRKLTADTRVEFDDGRIFMLKKGKWVAYSYDFQGNQPRTNLGAICVDDTPRDVYLTACDLYWGKE